MKVGIDAFGCDHGRSGLGSYLASVVRRLPETSEFSFELFGPEFDRYTYDTAGKTVSYRGINVPDTVFSERAWHATGFSKCCKKQKYDAVIFPAGGRMLPINSSVPSVIVVQDVLSDLYTSSEDGYYTVFMKNRIKKAGVLAAASEYIRDDLCEYLKIDSESVHVIPNGVDCERFFPRPKNNEHTILIQPFSIRRPYLIYVSRIEYPAKRHSELLQAFDIFKKKTGLPHRLVLAGADGQNAENVHREVLRSSVSSDVFLTGFFPPQHLPELYAGADACIFPSSKEGVGLSILEAMACGIPVACARAGALPEAAGDCALLFDPDKPEEIACAIEQIVMNIGLREDLIARGVERAKRYSWTSAVESLLRCVKTATARRA